jgi:hypothetical protein
LCTEISPKKVIHKVLCVNAVEPCAEPQELMWIKPRFTAPPGYPQSVHGSSTALTTVCKQVSGEDNQLTNRHFSPISTEIASSNNSSSNPLKNLKDLMILLPKGKPGHHRRRVLTIEIRRHIAYDAAPVLVVHFPANL